MIKIDQNLRSCPKSLVTALPMGFNLKPKFKTKPMKKKSKAKCNLINTMHLVQNIECKIMVQCNECNSM